MILADKSLHLTDLSLDNYLSMTDEVTLERITKIGTDGDSELKMAKSLALDYQNRRLLKCVFEKTVQGRDKFLTSIFTQKSFRNQLSEAIAKKAGVPVSEVYVDVPSVPSVPVSSTRESFTGVTVVSRKENGALTSSEISVEQMPLISTISGFMDVMRVYTTEKSRARVQKATNSALQAEGYESKVSM
jgi:hypothetical protein